MTVNKCVTDEWLEVHRGWHELRGRSTCTMMFGHIETTAERVETLERLRQLQGDTGGFTAFICWTFQPPPVSPPGTGAGHRAPMAYLPPVARSAHLTPHALPPPYL